MTFDIGHFCLVGAWLLTLYTIGVGLAGAIKQSPRLTQSASSALVASFILVLISFVALAFLFLNHDYRYAYVWRTSNNAMPAVYLVSAIWGGMDGSMLLWATIMAGFAALVVVKPPQVNRKLMQWAVPMLALATSFFLLVTTLLTNPFRLIPSAQIPLDGNGLNPLLQNPSMLIHPPFLYTGFTGFMVPFAFCLAALCSGQLGVSWTKATRIWTLVAWSFLTAGIILGGNWAYIELGWGGFWAWDPVENASFLPWLTATAYLHSVMVEERRGMLRVWNVSLSIMTYLLAVFGTFLTRSGVVQSVHAFAETDVGWVFLLYIGLVAAFAVLLIIYRLPELKPEYRLESYVSREAAFLFNNLALLGICFATFWGVMLPVFSEAITGEKIVVGPPFFNAVNVPLFLILIFLMGVGPLIAWRSTNRKVLRRLFLGPVAFGSALTVLCLFLDPARIWAAISYGLCAFVAAATLAELHRGIKVHSELGKRSAAGSFLHLLKTKPRKYGGALVHLGVLVMTVSITASMVYKIEKDLSIPLNRRVEVGRFQLLITALEDLKNENYSAIRAKVEVYDGKDLLTTLYPERRFYFRSEEATTEVAIRSTPRDDLYLALAGLADVDGVQEIALKVFVNPLQVWLWLGGVIVLIGTFFTMAPHLLLNPATAGAEQSRVSAGIQRA